MVPYNRRAKSDRERLDDLEEDVTLLMGERQDAKYKAEKTFLGISEATFTRWLILLALGLAAGGNAPTVLANLAKALNP